MCFYTDRFGNRYPRTATIGPKNCLSTGDHPHIFVMYNRNVILCTLLGDILDKQSTFNNSYDKIPSEQRKVSLPINYHLSTHKNDYMTPVVTMFGTQHNTDSHTNNFQHTHTYLNNIYYDDSARKLQSYIKCKYMFEGKIAPFFGGKIK